MSQRQRCCRKAFEKYILSTWRRFAVSVIHQCFVRPLPPSRLLQPQVRQWWHLPIQHKYVLGECGWRNRCQSELPHSKKRRHLCFWASACVLKLDISCWCSWKAEVFEADLAFLLVCIVQGGTLQHVCNLYLFLINWQIYCSREVPMEESACPMQTEASRRWY